ncbi:TQO small subunit DoxD [Paenibacillus sp. GCM10012307]|uniref:DoxX family membrane protein n=1 Tax=Paenibacillus roseus TaxID=2798579 RepID=A0A934J6I3_9BACL|nr:TQO small subunit DoxD [Paenibacillus roseus]MBJ6362644.1 DoxX family membrane protein [Paenibacillus roseus]
MIRKWWTEHTGASALLALLRIYLGWQWLVAGWHKLAAVKPFDATGFLNQAITSPVAEKGTGAVLYPTFTAFIEHFALPNVKLINFMIPLGEFLVGLGLILGWLTLTATFFGLLMNFMFMFAGTVSTNPWLILFGFLIILGGANAGRFGIDYYIRPFVNKTIARLRKGNTPVSSDHPNRPA